MTVTSDPTVNATTGAPCKGKLAARALAVMVVDRRISAWLAANDPKAFEQAKRALVPFGYPDLDVLFRKLTNEKGERGVRDGM